MQTGKTLIELRKEMRVLQSYIVYWGYVSGWSEVSSWHQVVTNSRIDKAVLARLSEDKTWMTVVCIHKEVNNCNAIEQLFDF